jgi:hypothetical protein
MMCGPAKDPDRTQIPTQFTCFTSAKVQKLAPDVHCSERMYRRKKRSYIPELKHVAALTKPTTYATTPTTYACIYRRRKRSYIPELKHVAALTKPTTYAQSALLGSGVLIVHNLLQMRFF